VSTSLTEKGLMYDYFTINGKKYLKIEDAFIRKLHLKKEGMILSLASGRCANVVLPAKQG
jgi:hypothetical protein